MRGWRMAGSATLLGAMLVLVGCTPTTPAQVTVAPATAFVVPGGELAFSVTVANADDPSVFWTASCGAIVGSGASITYVAPDVEGPCTVTATSVEDPTRSGAAAVEVARWAWARQFGTTGYDIALDAAIAANGDVVVVGTTSGPFVGINLGAADAFVVRYGPDGTERWRRQVGTPAFDEAEAVAIDAAGRVVVAGSTGGGVDGPSAGGDDAFVVVFDADGGELWRTQFGSPVYDVVRDVAVGPDGLVVLVGATQGALFAPNVGSTDAWVAKLDADGDPTWFRQYGTPVQDAAYGVAVDGDGNVVVGGRTDGSLFGPSAGASDAFVVKYTATLGAVWDLQFGTPAGEIVQALAVDARGHAFATGYTSGDLDGANAGLGDLYVLELDPDGDEVQRVQVGTEANENGTAVAVHPGGGVVVAGHGTGAFAEEPFGDTDALAIAFAADFSERWRRQFGSDRADYAWGVAVDGAGATVLVGETEGELLGASLGDVDAFAMRLHP